MGSSPWWNRPKPVRGGRVFWDPPYLSNRLTRINHPGFVGEVRERAGVQRVLHGKRVGRPVRCEVNGETRRRDDGRKRRERLHASRLCVSRPRLELGTAGNLERGCDDKCRETTD